jgi:iron complex transport system substrate-binding protein
VALLAAGCAAAPQAPPSPSVSGVPQRIVSLAPSVTEILFALGAGPRVAACTRNCNYPPEVASLPRVGDMAIDYERLLSIKPDLIIAESITREEDIRRLRELGMTVLRVKSDNLDTYRETLRIIGDATATRPAADKAVRELDQALRQMAARIASVPSERRPRVFLEIQDRPIISVGHDAFVSELVTLAGGRNIFADLSGYPKVDPEWVVQRNPEVVVLTVSQPADFGKRAGFGGLAAVRDSRVYSINPDLVVRPTPRVLQGLRTLADWMQPQ